MIEGEKGELHIPDSRGIDFVDPYPATGRASQNEKISRLKVNFQT